MIGLLLAKPSSGCDHAWTSWETLPVEIVFSYGLKERLDGPNPLWVHISYTKNDACAAAWVRSSSSVTQWVPGWVLAGSLTEVLTAPDALLVAIAMLVVST